jgi:hypothetical protein
MNTVPFTSYSSKANCKPSGDSVRIATKYQERENQFFAKGQVGTKNELTAEGISGYSINYKRRRDDLLNAFKLIRVAKGAQLTMQAALFNARRLVDGTDFTTKISPAIVKRFSCNLDNKTVYRSIQTLKDRGYLTIAKEGSNGRAHTYLIRSQKIFDDAGDPGWRRPQWSDLADGAAGGVDGLEKNLSRVADAAEAQVMNFARTQEPFQRPRVAYLVLAKVTRPTDLTLGTGPVKDRDLFEAMRRNKRAGRPISVDLSVDHRKVLDKWKKAIRDAERRLVKAGKIELIETARGRCGYAKYALRSRIINRTLMGQNHPQSGGADNSEGVESVEMTSIEPVGEGDFEPVPLEAYVADPHQNMDTEICSSETQTVADGNEVEGGELPEKSIPIVGGVAPLTASPPRLAYKSVMSAL